MGLELGVYQVVEHQGEGQYAVEVELDASDTGVEQCRDGLRLPAVCAGEVEDIVAKMTGRWRGLSKHRIAHRRAAGDTGGRLQGLGVIVGQRHDGDFLRTTPVYVARLRQRAIPHVGLEVVGVAGARGGILRVVVGRALSAPQHRVDDVGVVAAVDAGRPAIGNAIGGDSLPVALVGDHRELGNGATTVQVNPAAL